jgi:hypothetical protein
VALLRGDPRVRAEVLEVVHAQRAALYVGASALLAGHVALFGEQAPGFLRFLCAAWLPVAWGTWVRARRHHASDARRAAWVGWAVSCVLATVGIVATRHGAAEEALLPAGLYGLATFALGCTVAADARRFPDRAGLRWTCAFLLVMALLVLHQSLVATLWDTGHG